MTASGTRRPVPDDQFGGRLRDCYLLDLEVAEVVDAAPRLRSITFASADLVGFTWQPGQDVMLQVPGTDRAVRRRYTIRRGDPEAGTLDIEVVLHGDGPFARWAASAAVGDRVEGIGPRGVITVREGAAHHLFVGDESAIPATFAMVEALPAGTTATVVLATEARTPRAGRSGLRRRRRPHLAPASTTWPTGCRPSRSPTAPWPTSTVSARWCARRLPGSSIGGSPPTPSPPRRTGDGTNPTPPTASRPRTDVTTAVDIGPCGSVRRRPARRIWSANRARTSRTVSRGRASPRWS